MFTRSLYSLAVVIVSLSSLAGVAIAGNRLSEEAQGERRAPARQFAISGQWLLTMPKGFEYEVHLRKVDGADKYRLDCGATMLRGEYELNGRRLSMLKPDDERLTGLVWEIKNKNVLVLVEHPEKSQFGSDYRNATLSRQRGDVARPSLEDR